MRSKSLTPKKTIDIRAGEHVLLWLHTRFGKVQVEVRVDRNGEPEMFQSKEIKTRNFKFWAPM